MKTHLWMPLLLALLENPVRVMVGVAHLGGVWLCALGDGEQGDTAMW